MENKDEYHILLDMDGVITNFVGGVEKHFKVDLSNLKSWNMVSEINKQRENLNLTTSQFWKSLHKRRGEFWVSLEPYPWARDLINLCLEKTKGNVTIVTSPSMATSCASGKTYWLARHYPSLVRKLLIGPEKHLMAKPNHVLIDDSDSNIDNFKSYGGKVIIFPQKWNKKARSPYDIDVISHISVLLDSHIKTSDN